MCINNQVPKNTLYTHTHTHTHIYIYIYQSRYQTQTITDADYADDIALLANTPHQAESLLHRLEKAAGTIGLHVNADQRESMCFNQNQTRGIYTLSVTSWKLVDKFTYHRSSLLSIYYRSYRSQTYPIKATVESILLHGGRAWTLNKCIEKRLDKDCRRMLGAILNKSWKQHSTKQQLYSPLPPITKTVQIRPTRHAGHSWRRKG